MKALASDLDGTLVFDGKLKPQDLETIKQFQAKGNLFGICSGRPLQDILKTTKGSIDCDFYIAASGAVIADRNYNILYISTLSYEITKEIFEAYKDQSAFFLQADHTYYAYRNDKYQMPIMENIEFAKDQEICGISLEFKTVEEASKANLALKEKYPYLTGHQNIAAIDITMNDCSKGIALLKYKEMMHIDTIGGIGDSFNDLPMLENADIAFTFPYAPASLKEKADHIVDHVSNALMIMVDENV